jgi:hypothetical protein
MATQRTRYDLNDVKSDLKSFFKDNEHRAFSYGTKATDCNCDSVFYKKQIQVIFEDYYPHDVIGKAVNELIKEKYLYKEPRKIGKGKNISIIFIHNKKYRYVSTEIKQKIAIVEKFSDDDLNDGCGKQCEALFNHLFEKHQFNILGRNINKFRRKEWEYSDKDLDFIIEKDGHTYGIEIKNTFDYMPQDEF